ncbi:DUF1707 domain-containing protein [Nocardia vinacea]|uniref:DUF1707 domain-containing protein n=1 Tax=Nocardia vinacea TaxID=96468 RepID=A0ABZ1YIV6_9NOCA|nr:DUF1707 domain-containing protein [Nocardia vinacea]
MGEERLRASDADREKIAEQLRVAMNDGRLSLHEYDDRLKQVYAAKTYGELTPLLSDLPVPRNAASAAQRVPQWVVIMWIPWVAVNALCVTIWLATGAGYFWPFWVAVPWGCALLIPSAIGMLVQSDRKPGAEFTSDVRNPRSPGTSEST